MKKIFITIFIFTLTAVILTAVFVYLHFFSGQLSKTQQSISLAEEMEDDFEPFGVAISGSIAEKKFYTVSGLIVPHFEPVSNLIVEALNHVTTTPDLIILIAPNHYEAGTSPIITGSYLSSKFVLHPKFAIETMQQLAQMKVASYEDVVISGDHSIGTPLPFIVQRFQNTPIVAIVLKYHQNSEDIQNLLLALQKISTNNTLIIASLDFSHYLSSDIAPKKDAETQKYIENHDYKHIEGLSNDYIDSPWTLITFLRFLQASGVESGRILSHTNTGQVAGQTIESSTSFFTYIYKK